MQHHRCVPRPSLCERSEPGTSPGRSRYVTSRAGRAGPRASDPPRRPPAHYYTPRLRRARSSDRLVFPYAPRGTAIPLSLWPSAQAYASRCSLPNRLASSRPVANLNLNPVTPGTTDHGRPGRSVGLRRSFPRRSVRTAFPPAACPPASSDAGRADAGRAGSFNSGKDCHG